MKYNEEQLSDLNLEKDDVATDEKNAEIQEKKKSFVFDRLIMEKYKIDRDLLYQKFYKENKKMLHEMVFNNIKYSDLEIFVDNLPIVLEDPLMGSIFNLIVGTEEDMVTKMYPIALNDKDTYHENMEQDAHALGKNISMSLAKEVEEHFYTLDIFIEKETNKLILLSDEYEVDFDKYTFSSKVAIDKRYIALKYQLEDFNDFYSEENANMRAIVNGTLEVFVEDALYTYVNNVDTFRAIEIELTGTYVDSESKRHFIEEVFTFKNEFNHFYDKALEDIKDEEAKDRFLRYLEFTLDLAEEFNTNNEEFQKLGKKEYQEMMKKAEDSAKVMDLSQIDNLEDIGKGK